MADLDDLPDWAEPHCDKCGAEITTGFMFVGCPFEDQCALFPHSASKETQDFARRLIEGEGVITIPADDETA